MPKPDTLTVRKRQFMPDSYMLDFLFPEEFVRTVESEPDEDGETEDVIQPNVPPELRGGRYYEPRTRENTVGYPFEHAEPPDESGPHPYHFDRYLHLLMDAIRNYNRGLYRLRRAHFFYDHPDDFDTMPELDDEKEGLKLPEVALDVDPIEIFIAIEKEFVAATTLLASLLKLPLERYRDPITEEYLYVRGNVDCIRTNDYIISVRVGGEASDEPLDEASVDEKENFILKKKEPPYSSSSYTSISSPFSSYSSDTWQAGP